MNYFRRPLFPNREIEFKIPVVAKGSIKTAVRIHASYKHVKSTLIAKNLSGYYNLSVGLQLAGVCVKSIRIWETNVSVIVEGCVQRTIRLATSDPNTRFLTFENRKYDNQPSIG